MKLTYMDCWHFIAPLIPKTEDEVSMKVYIMVFHALKEAQEREEKESKEV